MAQVAAVGGTLLGVYSNQEEARLQSNQLKKKADLQRMEAKEILDRAKINSASLERQGKKIGQAQVSAFARGNVIGVSPLMFMEETNAQVKEEIALLNREAQFRANQAESGATILTEEAQSMRELGVIKSVGTISSGLGSMTSNSSRSRGV